MPGFKKQALLQLKKQTRDLQQRLPSSQRRVLDWQVSDTSTNSRHFFQVPEVDASLPDGQLVDGGVHEFLPASYADFTASLGFTLCCLQRFQAMRTRTVIWCSFGGRADFPSNLYPQGLLALGVDPANFLRVQVNTEKEFLWVLEEGLASKAGPLVVGAYMGAERLYNFTTSRRLSLRASRDGGTLLMLRNYRASQSEQQGQSTAAATRWRVGAMPSSPKFFKNARLPAMGAPRWQVTLTRCKGARVSAWQLEWQHETDSFHLVSPLAGRAPIEGATNRFSETRSDVDLYARGKKTAL